MSTRPSEEFRSSFPERFGSIRRQPEEGGAPYAVYLPKSPVQSGRAGALCYVQDWLCGFAVLASYHAGWYYPGMERDLAGGMQEEAPKERGSEQGEEPKERGGMQGEGPKERGGMQEPASGDAVPHEGPAPGRSATLREVYGMFYEWKFGEHAAKKLSDSTRRSAQSAYRMLQPLHEREMDGISIDELQALVNGIRLSRTSVMRVVILIKQLYRFALPRELCTKNRGEGVVMPDTREETHHQDFTDEELEILWRHRRDPIVRMVLIMCYSGFRVSEYLQMETDLSEGSFKGGLKTAAGKDRTVPIHSAIRPLVEEALKEGPYLCGLNINAFNKRMKRRMKAIGIDVGERYHTPHSCRHTFCRLCESCGVSDADRRRMLGHSFGGDITNGVYGHRTLEELRAEIEKIRV